MLLFVQLYCMFVYSHATQLLCQTGQLLLSIETAKFQQYVAKVTYHDIPVHKKKGYSRLGKIGVLEHVPCGKWHIVYS